MLVYITIIILIIISLPSLLITDILFGNILEIKYETKIPISIFAKMDYYNHMEGEYFFDGYKYAKIYLDKKQTDKIVSKINNNSRWRNDELDEWLKIKIEKYSKEEDTTGIRNVKNGYWLFKNIRSNATDIYNFDNYIEKLGDSIPAFIVAVLDIDNNLIYFYELIG